MPPKSFFTELREFSEAVFALLGLTEKESPWAGTKYGAKGPRGVVLHYTASNDYRAAVTWFMAEKWAAKVSAHLVIADGWPKGLAMVARRWPLVAALPAMVVQCVPLWKPAWHATWFNGWSIGIELVNSGELRKRFDGRWADCRDMWSREWVSEKTPVLLAGRYWEPYSAAQVLAAIRVLREIRRAVPGKIRVEYVVGHEQVQGVHTTVEHPVDKRDPGPAFPLEGVRAAAFQEIEPSTYAWFDQFSKNGIYGQAWQDSQVVRWRSMQRGNGYSAGAAVTPDVAWADYLRELLGPFLAETADFGAVGKLALCLLGYHTSAMSYAGLGYSDFSSLELFRKLMHLPPGEMGLGLRLRRAVVDRLEDRGVLGRLVK
jgi:N-acetyl-anhydromuramyl-L-alanine amidase AmpD